MTHYVHPGDWDFTELQFPAMYWMFMNSWSQKQYNVKTVLESCDRQSSFRLQLNSSFLTQRIISPSFTAWHMCRRSFVVERQGFKSAPPKVILTVSQTWGWQWRVEIFLSTSNSNQLTINIASHRCNLSPLTLDCFLWEILNRTGGEIWHKHFCFLLKGAIRGIMRHKKTLMRWLQKAADRVSNDSAGSDDQWWLCIDDDFLNQAHIHDF